jgi:hypothetical protein
MMMRKQKRACILCLAVAMQALTQPVRASAQVSDALTQCAAITNDTARLGCYDGLARSRTQTERPEPAESVSESSSVERPEAAARRRAGAAESGMPVESRPASGAESQHAAGAERSSGLFGRRRDRDSEASPESVTIVDVQTYAFDRKAFITSDERVYTQTNAESVRHEKPPFSAQIQEASMGSFFLTPEGSRRRVRVSLQE